MEEQLASKKGTLAYALALLQLRSMVEDVDGYYISTQTGFDANGERKTGYKIGDALGHEYVCQSFEDRMRRLATRAIRVRNKTLNNPTAVLDEGERTRIAKHEEIAAKRLIFMSREVEIIKHLEATTTMLDKKR